jgi:uncharacterized membrane protein YebE (DUF533 family)
MNKKLLIGAALLGAGVVAYKVYKKSTTPTAPPTPSPNVGTPPIAASENELRDKLKRAGASLLEIARQVYAWKQAKNARKAAKNPPAFSMTNPTYNA